jgi:transcriptional antiterminator NusG
MNENRWRVLHVKANHEKRVFQQLQVRSTESYLALYAERSRWTDRVVTVERPLFSGYVFARFSPETRSAVISIPGVIRLLGETERDTVSEVEVARIREALTSGYSLRPHPGIAVGSPVRVLKGVFAGVEGSVTDFRQQCKVVIALSATQQCFSLEVDLTDVEVLGRRGASQMPAPSRKMGHIVQLPQHRLV